MGSTVHEDLKSISNATIIYDGECPYCSNYVALQRLRAEVGNVDLIDARSDDPLVDLVVKLGYDLDHGMIFIRNGKVYYGGEAVNILALLSSSHTLFGRITRIVFGQPAITRLMYPVLKCGRNLTLRLLGREPINRVG